MNHLKLKNHLPWAAQNFCHTWTNECQGYCIPQLEELSSKVSPTDIGISSCEGLLKNRGTNLWPWKTYCFWKFIEVENTNGTRRIAVRKKTNNNRTTTNWATNKNGKHGNFLCKGQLDKAKAPDPGGSNQQIYIADSNNRARLVNIASANHPYLQSRTELRRARLTTSGWKHTKAPLAAAIQSMFDVGAQHHS